MPDWESLVNQLHDPDPKIRYEAAYTLRGQPDANVLLTLIEVALHDPESKVRKFAIIALQEYSSEDAIDTIIRTFDDPDEDVYRWAGFGKTQKTVALPKLIDLLKNRDASPQARSHTAHELSYFYDLPAVAPALLACIEDENEEARAACIETLAQCRDLNAVEPIIRLLRDDPSSYVRWQAASALGRIGDKKAVVPLIHALHDSHPDVRYHAAQSLGWLGDERAVEPLIGAVEDDFEDVRFFVVSALGNLRDKRATRALLIRLRDRLESLDVREEAALSLGFVGDRRAAKYLNHLLDHNDIQFSLHCAVGLGWLKDSRALPRLLEGSKYSNENVRSWSIQALGQLGSKASVETLLGVVQDDNERKYIRTYAIESLAMIGDPSVIETLRIFASNHDIRNLTNHVLKTIARLEEKVAQEI